MGCMLSRGVAAGQSNTHSCLANSLSSRDKCKRRETHTWCAFLGLCPAHHEPLPSGSSSSIQLAPMSCPSGDSLFLAPSHQASVFKETRGHLMSQLGALEHEGAPEKGHFPNSFSQAPL